MIGCFNNFNATFIWEYFGGAVWGKLNIINHLGNYNYWAIQGQGKINSTVSYLLCHWILDILIDVMCGNSHGVSKPVITMTQVLLNARVSKVQGSLADWTDSVAKFESLQKHHKCKERMTVMPPPQSGQSYPVQSGILSIHHQLVQSGLGIVVQPIII